MICKQTQNTIDALLRLKEKDEICANVISNLMNADKTQNKIASVTTQSRVGEVAELVSLLKAYIH
jgi:hypothetical protein